MKKILKFKKKSNMKTNSLNNQLVIQVYTRGYAQGSWIWQRKGISSLIAREVSNEKWHVNQKHVIKGQYSIGALGAKTGKNVIKTFTRKDAEKFAKKLNRELIPHIGGDAGPWLTKSTI